MKRILVSLFLVAAFFFNGCHGTRLTKANVDEVDEGMSPKQVESILGPPTSIDSTDFVIAKKITYTYRQDHESVAIVFINDKVTSKESSLRD